MVFELNCSPKRLGIFNDLLILFLGGVHGTIPVWPVGLNLGVEWRLQMLLALDFVSVGLFPLLFHGSVLLEKLGSLLDTPVELSLQGL